MSAPSPMISCMDEPKPKFTPHDEVQRRILLVLTQTKSGHLSTAAALDKVRTQFPWTVVDLYPWSGEHERLKFGERISYIRDHMVDMGLLANTDAMTWRLTREGADLARQLLREEQNTRLYGPRPVAVEQVQQESAGVVQEPAVPSPVGAVPAKAVRGVAQEPLFKAPQRGEMAPPAQPEPQEPSEPPVIPEPAPIVLSAQQHRDSELQRREQLWAALLANGGPNDVPRGLLRELKIYGNQAGIYVPSAETRTKDTPKGIALSFLHTGRHYDDELTATGVIYNYPVTGRSGHDESEVEASKAAYRASLPVFVIGPGSKATTRTVYRGYIEDVDDQNKVLLITFTRAQLPPPPTPAEQAADPFNLTDDEVTLSFGARRSRPNQVRFAFDVYKRYGTECAVCGLNVKGLLQAAHLLSKKDGGSDDPRNGLPLCANHHLAFDRGYWCMDEDLKLQSKADGPTLNDMAIVRADLSHLVRMPHGDAISRVWTDWQAKQKKTV